jgi:hypothetical protein
VADEKVEDHYLPFTDVYMGIPAVWLNETEGIGMQQVQNHMDLQ